MALTVETFDASICPSYGATQLSAFARTLGLELSPGLSRKQMCLEIRAQLPPSYTEYNGIRYLDPAKMKQLVNAVEPDVAAIYEFIWSHSKFYPTDVVLSLVDVAVDAFLDLGVKNYALYVPAEKWGSEQWLITEFYDKLGRPPLVRNLEELQPGSYQLVMLDDAAYSGTNLVMNLDNQLSNLPDQSQWKFHFYVVTGLITDQARRVLNSFVEHSGYTVDIISAAPMKSISEIVAESKFPMDWKLFNVLASGRGDSGFAGTTRPDYDATTVWLGHKIANTHGSMPEFLKPVMLTAPNRRVVEAAEARQGMLQYLPPTRTPTPRRPR